MLLLGLDPGGILAATVGDNRSSAATAAQVEDQIQDVLAAYGIDTADRLFFEWAIRGGTDAEFGDIVRRFNVCLRAPRS